MTAWASAWVSALLLAAATALLVPAAPPARPPRTPTARPPAGAGLRSGLRPGARRRQAARDRAAVLEVCDALAAELASGRPPTAALSAAQERWPPLAGVVEASRLGADVPDALRRLARERPGAEDLQRVASAWQVAHRTGHGLAAALERTAAGLRARRRTRRLVDSELASARATARLVACLPLAVLVMGSGAGSDPWAFLLGSAAGGACLVVGLGLLALGLWWIERLADAVVVP